MRVKGCWSFVIPFLTVFVLSGCAELQPKLDSAWKSVKSAFSDDAGNGDTQNAKADENSANDTASSSSSDTSDSSESSADDSNSATEDSSGGDNTTASEDSTSEESSRQDSRQSEDRGSEDTGTADERESEATAARDDQETRQDEPPQAGDKEERTPNTTEQASQTDTQPKPKQEDAPDATDPDEGPVSKEEVARLEEDAAEQDGNAEAGKRRSAGDPVEEDDDGTQTSQAQEPQTANHEAESGEEADPEEAELQNRIAEMQRRIETMQKNRAEKAARDRRLTAKKRRLAELQNRMEGLERKQAIEEANDPERPVFDTESDLGADSPPPEPPTVWENLRGGTDGDPEQDPWARARTTAPAAQPQVSAAPPARREPPLPEGLAVDPKPAPGTQSNPDNPNAGFARVLDRVAANAAASGNHATAVKMYRRAMRLTPERIEPAIGLGRSLSALGDHQGAVDAARTALKIDPTNPDAQFYLGKSLMAMDLPHQAIPHLEYAAGRRSNPRLYNDLGVAQDMVGDPSTAQAYYRSGLQMAGDNLELMSNLGISLALSGKFGEAIPLLERAASHQAANIRHRENLAFALVLAGDRRRAREVSLRDLSEAEAEARLEYYAMLAGMNRGGERRAVVTVMAGRKHSLSDVAEAHQRLRIASGLPARGAATRKVADAAATPSPRQPAPNAPASASDGSGTNSSWNVGAARSPAAPSASAAGSAAAPPQPLIAVPQIAAALPQVSSPPAARETPSASHPMATPRRILLDGTRRPPSPIPGPAIANPTRYQIQLGAYATPALAQRGWRRLSRQAPELLGGRTHFLRDPNPAYDWDRLFRLRTPALGGSSEARQLCAALTRSGLECLVVDSHGAAAGGGATAGRRTTLSGAMNVTPLPRSEAPQPAPRGTAAATSGQANDGAPVADLRRRQAARIASKNFVYEVQLAAYYRRADAVRGWRLLSRRAPDLLGDLDYQVEPPNPVLREDRLFRLRTVAYEDAVMARMLCRLLGERGIDCLVVRTRPDNRTAMRVPAPGTRRQAVQPAAMPAPVMEQPVLPEDRAQAAPAQPAALPAPSSPPATPRPSRPAVSGGSYELQFGAYSSREAAERNAREFAEAAPDMTADLAIEVRPAPRPGTFLLRSRRFTKKGQAEELCSELNARMLNCVVFKVPTSTVRSAATRAVAPATAPPTSFSTRPAAPTIRTRRATRRQGEAYQVQFAAYGTPDQAIRNWRSIQDSVPDILGDSSFVISAATPAGGYITQYRLRTLAYDSWEQADTLCRRLKARKIGCRVVITEDPASLLGDVGYARAPVRADRAAPASHVPGPGATSPSRTDAAGQAATASPSRITPN